MRRWSAEAEPYYIWSAGEKDKDGGEGGSRTLMALASSCSQKEQGVKIRARSKRPRVVKVVLFWV